MTRQFARIGAWAALALGVIQGSAQAQSSGADRAAAQALFDQAIKLMDGQKFAEACPKLEESDRLDPGTGTKFNLASCYTHTGKTASAWTLFLDVAAATHAAGQTERERAARDQARALEPKLPHLTISVTNPDKSPGIEVKRDGGAVSKALWGTPLPIDQGDHTIAATAPGMRAFSLSVKVSADGASVSAVVPELQPDAAASVAPPSSSGAPAVPTATSPTASGSQSSPEPSPPPNPGTPDTSKRGSTQRVAGLVIGGVGVVGLGVGIALGLGAKGKNSDAHADTTNDCPTATTCYPAGTTLVHSAQSEATIATVMFIAGGVALAGGAALFLTAPSSKSSQTSLRIAPAVGPGSGGISMGGHF